MPEFNLPLDSNDALYASQISGGEVAWGPQVGGYLWIGMEDTGCIHKTDTSYSTITQIAGPSTNPRALTLDNQISLWVGTTNYNTCIYHIDQSGSVIDSLYWDQGVTYINGLSYDLDTGCIWMCHRSPEVMYRLNQDGSILESFSLSTNFPKGVDLDNDKSLWTGTYFDGYSMYKYNQNGSVIDSFGSPHVPDGVGINSDGSIWLSDGDIFGTLSRVTTNGYVESQFATAYTVSVDTDS